MTSDEGEVRKLILTHFNGCVVSDLDEDTRSKLLAKTGGIARQDVCHINHTNDTTISCGGYHN